MSPEPSRPLRADVVYLAPSGRRCRWLPHAGAQRQITAYATFEYLRGPGSRSGGSVWDNQFVLTPPNYQLLRVDEVAR